MFEKRIYTSRRAQLKAKLESGLILLPGNHESSMNFKDNWYPFRQDSNFLYFFGIDMPGLCGVIDIDNDVEIIFGNDHSMDEIIFFRSAGSIRDQADAVGVDKTNRYDEIGSVLASAIKKGQAIHYLPPYRPEHTQYLSEWLGMAIDEVSRQVSEKLIRSVVSLRSIKSSEEMEQIEEAVNITASMQLTAMKLTRIGKTEAEITGAVETIAKSKGGGLSFPTILTTDAQILHNYYHGNKIAAERLLLCDCGAESSMHYAGDLSRTIPASSTFSQKQKEVYQVVLDSYLHAVSLLKPGVLFYNVHKEACIKLAEGLKQIGLMKGDVHEAVEEGAHALFFQCGLGHMMGLDVHDMESLGEEYVGYTTQLKKSTAFGWKSLRLGRALEPGFVLTVEPGIYFIPNLIDKWKQEKKFRSFIHFEKLEAYRDFGGIRIEDDYAITEEGYWKLGVSLPTTPDEIEAFRKNISH